MKNKDRKMLFYQKNTPKKRLFLLCPENSS